MTGPFDFDQPFEYDVILNTRTKVAITMKVSEQIEKLEEYTGLSFEREGFVNYSAEFEEDGNKMRMYLWRLGGLNIPDFRAEVQWWDANRQEFRSVPFTRKETNRFDVSGRQSWKCFQDKESASMKGAYELMEKWKSE